MNTVLCEVKDHIALITISREKVLNALSNQVFEELDGVIDRLSQDNDIYCAIVTGAGKKSFVAGADIIEMKDLEADQAKKFGNYGSCIFRKIEQLRFPVIAAVNGYALGGGLELALACDIRVASDNALFGFPEVGLGIIPGYGGTQRLPRIISVAAAKKLLYTAAKINAQQACFLGIVDRVFDANELMDNAMKLALDIAGQAPIAVAKLKRSIDQGLNQDIDTALKTETMYFSQCFDTQDQKDAMNAFVNKTKIRQFKNQ